MKYRQVAVLVPQASGFLGGVTERDRIRKLRIGVVEFHIIREYMKRIPRWASYPFWLNWEWTKFQICLTGAGSG